MTESEINRNESFYSQISKFAMRRKTVYNLIKTYNGLTDYEIAQRMVLPINSATGRRKELLEEEWIKPVFSKLNEKTNKMNTVWVVTSPEERERLIKEKLYWLNRELGYLTLDLDGTTFNCTEELIESRIKKLTKLINKLS